MGGGLGSGRGCQPWGRRVARVPPARGILSFRQASRASPSLQQEPVKWLPYWWAGAAGRPGGARATVFRPLGCPSATAGAGRPVGRPDTNVVACWALPAPPIRVQPPNGKLTCPDPLRAAFQPPPAWRVAPPDDSTPTWLPAGRPPPHNPPSQPPNWWRRQDPDTPHPPPPTRPQAAARPPRRHHPRRRPVGRPNSDRFCLLGAPPPLPTPPPLSPS